MLEVKMMTRDDEFVIYNQSIEWMLKNIIDKSTIILKDFERNGRVHPDYIEEKLSSAKYDLDNLYSIALRKIEENKKGE